MPEKVGLLDCCRELGVIPLAYSPIGQGRLTGKFSVDNPPPKARDFSAHPMEEVDKVVDVLRRIGAAHGERTPSQVALAWIIAKGAIPIPGAKSAKQASGQRRRAGLAPGRRRAGRARCRLPLRHPDPQPTTLATRLS